MRRATISAAIIFAISTVNLETGAESSVSRVLSIFSVEMAVIIIWEAMRTRKNTAKGAIIDWFISIALSASEETSTVFPLAAV